MILTLKTQHQTQDAQPHNSDPSLPHLSATAPIGTPNTRIMHNGSNWCMHNSTPGMYKAALWCRHHNPLGACTACPLVHAPPAPWCMHHRPLGACTAGPSVHGFVLRLLYRSRNRYAPPPPRCMHHRPLGACTTGPLVHAPPAPWCMHHRPLGACTTGPFVHVLKSPDVQWQYQPLLHA